MTPLKSTFKSIRNFKLIFIIMILIQFVFLIAFFSLFKYYALEIEPYAKEAFEELQGPGTLEENILMKDTSVFNEKASQMIAKVLEFILFSYLLYILFSSLLWDTAYLIAASKEYSYWRYFPLFAVSVILLTLPALFILLIGGPLLVLFLGIPFILLALYFLPITFILSEDNRNLLKILKQAWKTGIKNILRILSTYLISLLLIAASSAAVFLSVLYDLPFIIILISLLIFMTLLSWTKIYITETIINFK